MGPPLIEKRVFNLAKNTLEWRGFVGISRDYPLKTRTSKQPTGEISGFKIIPSHPLKYLRSKQGLRDEGARVTEEGVEPISKRLWVAAEEVEPISKKLWVGVRGLL
jgi:hypothetical protein